MGEGGEGEEGGGEGEEGMVNFSWVTSTGEMVGTYSNKSIRTSVNYRYALPLLASSPKTTSTEAPRVLRLSQDCRMK